MVKAVNGRAFAIGELSVKRGKLDILIIGAAEEKVSLGGKFCELSLGRGRLDVAKIPDGRHTLILHLPEQALPLCEVEKYGRSAKRIYTECDVKCAEVGYAELYGRLSSLEQRVKKLEVEAFESVLF